MVGVAVKFTAVPEQTVVLLAAIDTEGVIIEETVMVTALLVEVLVDWQALLLIMTTVITSLFNGAFKLYAAEVAPVISTPFFLH